MLVILRGSDKHGSGNYGAPRGTRTHKGMDISAAPLSTVFSPVKGTVTKLGRVYSDESKKDYRYVQITDEEDIQHRVFYVDPLVVVGQTVSHKDAIGKVQNLGLIYSDIINHVHYEIMINGVHVDPEKWVFCES